MADFFRVTDRKDLGGVLYSRIFDPAASSGAGRLVYLDNDPTGGSWLPAPAVLSKTGITVTSKLEYLVPYATP
ncbi:MAG: hypothetical protein E7H74_18520 [Escherichia coli]|nr:hypothetical protein [Escherichia coli]QVV96916.1 hypothetical protein [Kosakonia phage Kc259]